MLGTGALALPIVTRRVLAQPIFRTATMLCYW
jgi:hypothetical protein